MNTTTERELDIDQHTLDELSARDALIVNQHNRRRAHFAVWTSEDGQFVRAICGHRFTPTGVSSTPSDRCTSCERLLAESILKGI